MQSSTATEGFIEDRARMMLRQTDWVELCAQAEQQFFGTRNGNGI